MIDYKEIFDAWKTSLNPTEIEEELAQKRINVCLGCDFRKEVLKGVKWSMYCGHCGCPINKKAFSKMFNPCTKGFWYDVDSNYLTRQEVKKTNTII